MRAFRRMAAAVATVLVLGAAAHAASTATYQVTGPVLAVTDAVVLAPLVHGVSFVIGAEMTRWRLAERAIETLQAGHPRAIAAILNRVDFDRNRYYYSRYYGHQYKSYYGTSTSGAAPVSPAKD